MNTTVHALERFNRGRERWQDRYRVRLLLAATARAERRLIRLIRRKRGDLLRLERRNAQRPERLDVYLGPRRLHDVVDALEAEGVVVAAVVATQAAETEAPN